MRVLLKTAQKHGRNGMTNSEKKRWLKACEALADFREEGYTRFKEPKKPISETGLSYGFDNGTGYVVWIPKCRSKCVGGYVIACATWLTWKHYIPFV